MASMVTQNLLGCAIASGALLLAGCGGGGGSSGGGGGGGSSGGGGGQLTVSMSVSPAVLDFGNAVIGQTVAGVLVITNTGTATFSPTVATPAAGFVRTGTCGSLAPNATCSVQIDFSPTEQRAYESTLNIASGSTQISATLRGRGQGLNVEVIDTANSCTDSTVTVALTVNDAGGDPVLGLRTDQLEAFLNGIGIVPLSELGSITERETVAVGLVIDWSRSLQAYRQDLIDATSVFIDNLGFTAGDLIDRAGVFRFARFIDRNAQIFIDADAAGRQALKDALNLPYDGSDADSAIWEWTDNVTLRAENQPNPSRSVILLTDGLNNVDNVSLDTTIENAQARGINVFTVGFGDLDPGPLQLLADSTGGLFFSDPDASGLAEIFAKISSVLTNRYQVTFTNPAPGTPSQLRLVINDDAGREGEDSVSIAACP